TCVCSPHHQDSAYHPIVGHMERAAGFRRGEDAATRLAKLENLLGPSDGETIALIADLLSVPTGGKYKPLTLSPRQRRVLTRAPRQCRVRTEAALIEQFVRVARPRPVLMKFSDVHWIDPSSREVLDALIKRIVDLPVLLIVTHRPEFAPPWSSLPHATTLT